MMLPNRTIRMTECLAKTLACIAPCHWPEVIRHAQATIDLAEYGARLSLSGSDLVLADPIGQIITICPVQIALEAA